MEVPRERVEQEDDDEEVEGVEYPAKDAGGYGKLPSRCVLLVLRLG
jgi:hypothetical protein